MKNEEDLLQNQSVNDEELITYFKQLIQQNVALPVAAMNALVMNIKVSHNLIIGPVQNYSWCLIHSVLKLQHGCN